MKYLCYCLAVSIAIILHACSGTDQPPIPKVDHHMHIRSENAAHLLARIRGSQADTLPATDADDVIQLLDSAGVEKGSLLSLAYFYGMPDIEVENEYRKVQTENDFVIKEATKYPDRLYAFCSVNPLAEYAIVEIRRCAEKIGVTGLKLHFGNSNVDLRNRDHVKKVNEIFREAARLDLPVVVHMWTRNPDYGRKDAQIFINGILENVPDLTVQIAHLGGAGFFSSTTESVMGAFVEAKETAPQIMDNIIFDLGAAAADPAFAFQEGDSTRGRMIEDRNVLLAQQIREIGVEHIVFGSDWWARQPPLYVETVRSLLLRPEEIRAIFNNTAGYVNR